jgi:hypothetical protein
MTPSGRLLRRSAGAADRPAVFAAQFALSHLCWRRTYPLAGWLGPAIGLAGTLFALAIVALAGAGLAWRLWPAADPEVVRHEHANLHTDHPHLESEKRVHAQCSSSMTFILGGRDLRRRRRCGPPSQR